MRHGFLKAVLAAAVLASAVVGGWARFINNTVKVPVDRVAKNVEAWIQEKPQDAQAYYVLGRIHAMAWAYGPELNLWGTAGRGVTGKGEEGGGATQESDPFAGNLPGFAPYDSVQVRRDEQKKQLTPDDARHLEQAIIYYGKAVELDPKKAIYELSLGWILQETGKVAKELPVAFIDMGNTKATPEEKAAYSAAIAKLGDGDAKVRDDATKSLNEAMPRPIEQLKKNQSKDAEVAARIAELLKGYWDGQAFEHYRKAYAIDLQKDLASRKGMAADSQVAGEAGAAIVQILGEHPLLAKGNEAAEVAANVKTIQSKMGPMTPIIFAMPGSDVPVKVADLIDPLARTRFDLAGDGMAREWPWVKPGTAILVWDPMATGRITTGRALFGGRTWWMMFRDGYEALSVLDDNRDGMLGGAELEGIRVWIDKNGDGISQQGEIISLEQAGIISVGVYASSAPDGTLFSPRGVTFTNEKSVKTFDWVTEPLPRRSEQE